MDEANNDEETKWIISFLERNPPPNPLPPGWVIRSSRSQPGTYFYYHQETGESRWDVPVAFIKNPVPLLSKDQTNAKVEFSTTSNPSKGSADKKSIKHVNSSSESKHPSKKAKRSSDEPKEVRALHILKKHKGSRRPSSWRSPNITSTLEEARQELQELSEVLQEVRSNPEELRATFEELARTESDCSSAKRGGDLGFFGRKKMQPSFEAASFSLGIGELSNIIETSSGVHVILRIG
mmetsp:Transcript_10668/g.16336  ORF Transcript_10668/g.16336 Transcript_10668/m.16336 type:complete len:237 (+) Transcript_10668:96-806(+)|eukprot:CAMPEP_0178926018 /NCGR_PEP_ID=MMETSP0786-20121207/18269_1 /TAXON_ID=186022 /ORGANISM="Thalassionema frauenfeldii, Strain CCMP 1798" /LENGTH=236 /DNA_ID=CAMNT_0020601033 /DNA_START=30 /DNA_END=740 /DNA_ORIENTATION=+